MSVLDFVTKNPQLVVLIATTVGGLLWHRNRSINLNDLWDTAMQLGKQALPMILKDTRLYDDQYVLSKITASIWAGLDRLEVKHTPTVDDYVKEAAEHIKGDLAAMLADAHLGGFIDTQSRTLETIKADSVNQ